MKIKELIFGNLGLKILSVTVAMSLWFFITYRGQSETTIEAQVEFKNVPEGFEILKQNIKKVSINVSGHESVLSSLKTAGARVLVDMSNGKLGEASYYFDTNDVKMPANVKILRIDPTYVRVTLDESTARDVEVKPYIVGEPARGYEIGRIVSHPQVVRVEGPKTEMSRLSVLRTDPIDVTGLDADISQNVRVDANGRNVRIKTPDVMTKVIIRRKK
ncbi:MAG TPA: CdaR family protein [Dissulfurispiraceae bacterium]|nr:CdaR family protein [Dissulfurispiraceae bacterium]